MKKALTLLLSFVIVLTFAGCSFKYNVFQNIEQKSKRFSYLNMDLESTSSGEVLGNRVISCSAPDGITITITYDGTDETAEILNVNIVSERRSEEKYVSACKSALLIEKWGLSEEDVSKFVAESPKGLASPEEQQFSSKTAGTIRAFFDKSICYIYTQKGWEDDE